MEHIICVNNRDYVGIGYSTKVHPRIVKKYGVSPITNHYNCAMAMALADLEMWDKGEFCGINTDFLKVKAKILPAYRDAYMQIVSLYKNAFTAVPLQESDNIEKPDKSVPKQKRGSIGKKEVLKLAYMLDGAVYSFCRENKVSKKDVIRALCALAAYYEEKKNIV